MTSRKQKFEISSGAKPLLVSVMTLLLFSFGSIANADPWGTHKSSLAARETKMGSTEEEIKTLIEEKNHAENPEEVRHLTQEIAERHKALETLAKEQREEQLHIRFQHPEKGDESLRIYSRHKIKSIEEMESEYGLDAKLNQIQQKVRVTFATEPKTELEIAAEAERVSRSAHDKRLPASEGDAQEDRIKLSK